MSWESRSGSGRRFWFRAHHEVLAKKSSGITVIWRLDRGLEDPILSSLMWILAGHLSALNITLNKGELECPHNIAAGFPQREWSKTARQSRNIFCYLALGDTLFNSHAIQLATQISPIQCGRGPCRGINTKRQESLWGISEDGHKKIT